MNQDDGSQAYHEQVSMAERFFYEKEAKMSFVVKENSGGGGNFASAPAGAHVARCYRIVDLGTQDKVWQGNVKKVQQVMISWELPDALIPDGKLAGQPFAVSERFTASLSEKSRLRAVLESWRGRKFTEEELNGFDLQNILGKPCFINLVQAEKNGKTYSNIASIMPLPNGMQPKPQVNPSLMFSLGNFDVEVFNKLSPKIQETIKQSPEYGYAVASKDRVQLSSGGVEELNDDIPF